MTIIGKFTEQTKTTNIGAFTDGAPLPLNKKRNPPSV